jgi:hypothetical protein
LWGRLSYEPDLPEARFERILAQRFPEVQAGRLASTWARASHVFPLITRFSWGDIDLRWYPEASLSHPKYKGFYTVRHFIEGETMPGSGVLDLLKWRESLLSKKPVKGTTPLEIASALKSDADAVLPQVQELRKRQGSNQELKLTLGDIEAMAHLANYYGEKILGAADLAVYDATSDASRKQSAVKHLESALAHWKQYADVYSRQYKPQLLNRVGFVNIPELVSKVEQDVVIARDWQPGTIKAGRAARHADNPFRP